MRFPSSIQPTSRRARGVALVIVLAFIVLITGLIVAYFVRSINGRQLSNSSASQTKAATLAQSAADLIISGFKKEIYNGSKITPAGSSSVYAPSDQFKAVPIRYPAAGANGDLIPNLVRESVRGDTANSVLPAPAVPSFASAVNTSTDAAIDGRKVTPARWNSHFLIPSKSTATVADSTPDDSSSSGVNFTAPDWVLVTRNGPAVQTAVGSGGALNDASPSNGNFVIGRYAYAVYDEGGLLDINVAGHPTPGSTAAQTGFTVTQASRKNSLAMADLTQLPLVRSPSSSSDYLSQTTIDNIVGWRNYQSAGLTGSSFPNFIFSPAQAANWFTNFASNNSTGFLQVYGGQSNNQGATDQAFSSRQSLLKLRASLASNGFGANVLQYLGTFSRSLEQPSYVPAHLRDSTAPNINAVFPTAPPTVTGPNSNAADNYQGNNDAAGFSGSTVGQDLINPSFLTVRVGKTFLRFDGTNAVSGEPLIKHRFSLKRLAWLTYRGPSAENMTDPVVMKSITALGGDPSDPNDAIYKLVAQGTRTNISNYFGLTWGADPSNPTAWVYNHGQDKIRSLSDVAADTANPREPDFVELLKAAINVGSLAKAGPNLNTSTGKVYNYQYTLDYAVDYNVLQIVANLIDQFDADSYPTVIEIKVAPPTGAPYYRSFCGAEDLPYFYRFRPFGAVTQLPSPLLSKSDSVTFPPGVGGNSGTSNYTFTYLKQTSLTSPGTASLFYLPEIWNPHDLNNATVSAAYRPAAFRVVARTSDPLNATSSMMYVRSNLSNLNAAGGQNIVPRASYAVSPSAALSSTLQFSDNAGQLFREPTLLWRATHPAGVGLTGGASATDINTGKTYLGLLVANANVSKAVTISGQSYVAQATSYDFLFDNTVGGAPQIDFQLQYQNYAGQWIKYDEKYPDQHDAAGPQPLANKADSTTNSWQNPFATNFGSSGTAYDPRTGRFGMGDNNVMGTNSARNSFTKSPEIDTSNTSSAGNTAIGNTDFTLVETQRPRADSGNYAPYSNPCTTSDSSPGKVQQMHWGSGPTFSDTATFAGSTAAPRFYDGLLAQNNPAASVQAKDRTTTAHVYYEDPDGIVRRAMGAYIPTGGLDVPATSIVGQPLAQQAVSPNRDGVVPPNSYSPYRPWVLNRPFRSVGEMSYTWRGGVWKNIDFFTPESGDAALLDIFCVDETGTNALAAGKVNLNSHQLPVLKAMISGAYQDESADLGLSPGYPLKGPLTAADTDAVARQLLAMTTSTSTLRGPLTNIGDLVGRYIGTNVAPGGATDQYTYTNPAGTAYTYAGFSSALNNIPAANWSSPDAAVVQKYREASLRALSAGGQARVWNLLIDVVAQTGRYPVGVTDLTRFSVEGETRLWVHVAIDRYTGEIIDRQIEIISE